MYKFCIAPMMDWSDKHCRYFWRLLTKKSRLYTEMITTGAIIHGDAARYLAFNSEEHPIAVQLGGNDSHDLAKSARICADFGYDEINLNVGCPSDRVKSGAFGASLMNHPQTVADGVKAMRNVVDLPVTIKCRIGVDDNDSYEALQNFVGLNAEAGCDTFIVHARKAWLSGLSPKQNREIPPLEYPRVFQLKQDFPELKIILNGGLKTIAQCKLVLVKLDGVMVGREAYQNPFMLNDVDRLIFGENETAIHDAMSIAESYASYIEQQLSLGVKLNHMTRHTLGLFNGKPGARQYRRHLSENAYKNDAGVEVYLQALNKITATG